VRSSDRVVHTWQQQQQQHNNLKVFASVVISCGCCLAAQLRHL
jgi:hypothetical protein